MRFTTLAAVPGLICCLWAQSPLAIPAHPPAIVTSDSLATEWLIHHSPDGTDPILLQTFADAESNLYVLFWANEWTSQTGAQLGIFKYGASGSVLWETYHPLDVYSVDDPFGNSIRRDPLAVIDSAGNLYISAVVRNDTTDFNILSLKIYSTGQLAWQQQLSSSGLEIPAAVTLGGDSAFIVTAQSEGTDGYPDIMTITYDSSGTLQWQARLDGPAFTSHVPLGIHVDMAGAAIVFGYTYNVSHGEKILLAKHSPGGNLLWSQQYQENGIIWRAYALRSDTVGSIYLAAQQLSASRDFHLLKYDGEGSLQWIRSKESTSLAYLDEYIGPRSFVLDRSGNGLLVLSVRSYLKVVKFDEAGTVLWESGCVQDDWTASYAAWFTPFERLILAGLTGTYEHICDHCPHTYPKSIVIARFDPGGHQSAVYLEDVTIPAYDFAHSYELRFCATGLDHIFGTVSTFIASEPTGYYTLKFNLSRILALPSPIDVPATFILHQSYPNPFNPATTISYDLPEGAVVRLVVYDLQGREVTRLAESYLQPGSYQATWDGCDAAGRPLPSGIYIARLVTPGYRQSIKMLLLK
ncbi:MAG: T9SS type A sorting domain-containing protein [Fidelibacterota bacterium]|nr:MAG: T9SS type A sorting domain-containing protein [Candidatus Neomarinimicrobiota bacterium]